ncbi:unnamed protein product [Soboliphyme baturini]|uniref:Glyco_hydro_18 domain-containing protein n=1 Tax=Soboliphyme baturini TaxID=241478 RepID=A0A183J4P4_9BILA|nr:unnamed protein product [Soboliphyme baturini]
MRHDGLKVTVIFAAESTFSFSSCRFASVARERTPKLVRCNFEVMLERTHSSTASLHSPSSSLRLWSFLVSARFRNKDWVCYYPEWAKYRPPTANLRLNEVDPFLCSHVIIAFAQVVENEVRWPEEDDEHTMLDNVKTLKTINPDLKVLIACGGWGNNSDILRDTFASESGRRTFVTSAKMFLDHNGLDGIDIDFEYPTREEKTNLTNVLKVRSRR